MHSAVTTAKYNWRRGFLRAALLTMAGLSAFTPTFAEAASGVDPEGPTTVRIPFWYRTRQLFVLLRYLLRLPDRPDLSTIEMASSVIDHYAANGWPAMTPAERDAARDALQSLLNEVEMGGDDLSPQQAQWLRDALSEMLRTLP